VQRLIVCDDQFLDRHRAIAVHVQRNTDAAPKAPEPTPPVIATPAQAKPA